MKLGQRTGLVAAATIAVLVSAGLPSVANAEDDSVVGVLEKAETVAVGAPTPADVESPVLEARGDGVDVDVNGSDLTVTLGASSDAAISESGQYATVEDASVTYAVSHPAEGTTRFSAILPAPGEIVRSGRLRPESSCSCSTTGQ